MLAVKQRCMPKRLSALLVCGFLSKFAEPYGKKNLHFSAGNKPVKHITSSYISMKVHCSPRCHVFSVGTIQFKIRIRFKPLVGRDLMSAEVPGEIACGLIVFERGIIAAVCVHG